MFPFIIAVNIIQWFAAYSRFVKKTVTYLDYRIVDYLTLQASAFIEAHYVRSFAQFIPNMHFLPLYIPIFPDSVSFSV